MYALCLVITQAKNWQLPSVVDYEDAILQLYIISRKKINIRSYQDNKFTSILLRALIWIKDSKIILTVLHQL